MKSYNLHSILWILLSICPLLTYSQEESTDVIQEANRLKTLAEGNAFSWGGNINADFRLNAINGIDRRADPFDFRLNGTVHATLYGVRTALNINLADGKIIHRLDRPDVKLPAYAYLGMSPSYKWAKIHLGYRNLTFSDYTFNGTNFYGAGMELSPGNFRLKTFYGRLQRARPEIADIPSSIDPSYLRMGWGIQTGYQKGRDEIYLILFSATDRQGSITQPIIRNDVRAMDNFITSIKGKKSISKNIFLDWDYAYSGITRDLNAPEIENRDELSFIYDFAGLYKPRLSTGFHKALKTGINLTTAGWNWDLRHERVDPGYRSLGALFFNNDYENVSVGFKKPLFKRRVNLSGRLGLQRNNLSGTENNSMQRVIGQVNTNIKISDKWNLGIAASNFSNTNILRVSQLPIPDNDSLLLTQVNRNVQVNSTYITGKHKQNVWNGFISYQQFNTITNEEIDFDKKVDNIMTNISHSYRFLNKSSLTNTLNLNQNINSFAGFTSTTLSHAYGRSFKKDKIKSSLRLGNTLLYSGNDFSRHLILVGITTSFKINDKVDLGAILTMVNQTNTAVTGNAFQEYNCRIRFKTKL